MKNLSFSSGGIWLGFCLVFGFKLEPLKFVYMCLYHGSKTLWDGCMGMCMCVCVCVFCFSLAPTSSAFPTLLVYLAAKLFILNRIP